MAHSVFKNDLPAWNLIRRFLFLALSVVLFIPFSFGVVQASKKPNYEADLVSTFFTPNKTSRKDIQKYTDLMKKINERNAAVEDSQEWIKEAYKGFMIRRLNDIPREDYAKYKKYAGPKGRAYIVVHPAYYTFFGEEDMTQHPLIGELEKLNRLVAKGGPYPEKNLVERLYDMTSFDDTLYVMQEQERMLRDFMEVYSTEGDLIILILPRDYQARLYGYKEGYDEYARYINEITNGADNVIYLDSVTVNRGGLLFEDLDMLMEFLTEAGIKTIAVGGGYVGRCLEGFYESIIDPFGYDHVYMIPEIVAVSPSDIQGEWGANLLTRSGRLNLPQFHRNLLTQGSYGKDRTIPKLKHFYMYQFLKAKDAREEGERVNDADIDRDDDKEE